MATGPGASPAAPVPVPSLLNLAAQVTAAALALGQPRVVAEIAELPRDMAEYVANIFFKTKLDAADVAAGAGGGGSGRLSGGGGSRGSRRGRGSTRGSGGGANWPAGTVGGGTGSGGFLGGGNSGLDGDAGGRGGNSGGGGGGGAAKHLPALRALAEHAALSPAALTLSDRTLSRAGLGGAVQVDSRTF